MNYPDDFINKIICGNSKDIIKEIPDKSINLILTDPPYLLYPGGGCGEWARNKKYIKEIIEQKMDEGFDFKLLEEYKRILINMNLIIFCGKNELRGYLNWIYDNEYRFVLITWNKTNPVPYIGNNYLPDTEYIFHIWNNVKLNGTYKTKKKYYITSVNKNNFDHPTVKPLEIVKNLLINSTKEQDIVLDPFCGTGTTCVACKELKRKYIGIEIKQKIFRYFRTTSKRYKK